MNLNYAILEYKRNHFPTLAKDTRRLYNTIALQCITPRLALMELQHITNRDIRAMFADMADKPYMANRTLAFLSSMFNYYAITPNPCKGIRRYNERQRETYLTPEQLATLGNKLLTHSDKHFAAAILLLLTTGCRKREILTAEWSHVLWSKKQLLIPRSKGGKKYIVLNEAAMSVLEIIYDASQVYVIPGKSGPRVNIDKAWRKLGMGVRIHDLRHTFASLSANSPDCNIFMLRDLLHHSSVVVTERYAHLFDKSLRQTSDEAMKGLHALKLRDILKA